LLVFAALVLSFAGGYFAYLTAHSIGSEQTVIQPPTAGEIFNFRSRCADLGKTIMDGDAHGPAVSLSQASHYDVKTNRCYVELDASNTGPKQEGFDLTRTLFDGQTGEILAWLRSNQSAANVQPQVSCGVLDEAGFRVPLSKSEAERCQNIGDKILELMADDRNQ
jgi:hypothetical protein